MTTKRVSVAAAKRDLPRLLKESQQTDILIFNERAGALAGALLSGQTYQQFARVRAYLEALRISGQTRRRRLQVAELLKRSRSELEARHR